MRGDFEKAILYYLSAGLSLEEALSRLDVENLGGFYSRPPIIWYPLDDAAKIYPLSMKHGQMAVFRLSVYLTEPVIPEILQMALTFTIKRFPSFATTVKKGFFWHYLDTAKRRFYIEPEQDIPCRPLKVSGSSSQSFRVLYYENRISAEFFHILTDGTGGMVFLKTLTAEYLHLLGVASPCGSGVLDVNSAPGPEETANEFSRAEKTEKTSGFVDKPAVQMSGRLSWRRPCRVLHFNMDAYSLKEAAASRGVSVTAYLLSRMFIAGRAATDEFKGNICIQVPVNMRKFYPSRTLRNFSLYCGVKLPIGEITGPDDILPEITRQLEEKASKGAMAEMMTATSQLTGMLGGVPLAIKSPVASLAYGFVGERVFSNTLSNLGLVKMPPELEKHVKSMDFVLGTVWTNRASCALVTFGGVSTLSISKMTADPSFEEGLHRLLRDDGVEAQVDGSELYES